MCQQNSETARVPQAQLYFCVRQFMLERRGRSVDRSVDVVEPLVSMQKRAGVD